MDNQTSPDYIILHYVFFVIMIQGVTNGVAAVLPSMVARGSGHIVNTSSDYARFVSTPRRWARSGEKKIQCTLQPVICNHKLIIYP